MKLDVIKSRGLWWSISLGVILAGIVGMVVCWTQFGSPLRPSLDFVGGTRLQFELDCTNPQNCQEAIETGKVREILTAENLGDSGIQIIDKYGVSIRSKTLDVEKRTRLEKALRSNIGEFNPSKTQIDSVGPTLGQELFRSGLIALILSFVGIILYLTFRFQFDYAFFAIVALVHDVLITAGVFAILGVTLNVEVDSLFLVSLLTIIGFSVNDTVVIYDRIRENIEQYPQEDINEIVDLSVNQTLSRSINTTLTTLLPLIAIFLFGGETLKLFALALIVGFAAGVYSSVFIASTLLAWWRQRKLEKQVA